MLKNVRNGWCWASVGKKEWRKGVFGDFSCYGNLLRNILSGIAVWYT